MQISLEIQREINRGLNGYILQNLYIPRGDGNTTEIDLLFICSKGLFIIESKNYAGYIFGDDRRKYWTVSLYAGKGWLGESLTEKYRFYNPVWQNKTHEKYLQKAIGTTIPLFSVIVFSDRGDLMNVSYDAEKVAIIQTSQLHSFFSFVWDNWPDTLSDSEIQHVYETLYQYTQIGEEEKQKHVDQIDEERNHPTKCPWCGGPLVLRTAKRGSYAGRQFYGCANYPKCKYIRNIDK